MEVGDYWQDTDEARQESLLKMMRNRQADKVAAVTTAETAEVELVSQHYGDMHHMGE